MWLSAHSTSRCLRLALCILATCSLGASAQGSRDLAFALGPMYQGWTEGDSTVGCCLVVQAPSEASDRRRPIQVALVLDVSRETAGSSLKAIKEAAIAVVNTLAEGDQLAIVSFSDYPRTIFSMQQLNLATRKAAASAIEALRDEAGRNFGAGLEQAGSELTRTSNASAAGSYLFALTIGDANKGAQNPDALLRQASQLYRDRGVAISTFGFSTFDTYGANVDFDEDLLARLALDNAGRYYFVEDPAKAGSIVGREAERISAASARQVAVEINTQSRAVVTDVLGALAVGSKLLLGDMLPGERRLVMFDLLHRPDKERDIVVTASYMEPEGVTERRLRAYARIPLTAGSKRLDRDFGPYLTVLDFQEDLVLKADRIAKNRRDYLTMYRSRLKELEQINNGLGSSYIADQLKYYRTFETDLDDTALPAEKLIKHTKFRLLELLYGTENR